MPQRGPCRSRERTGAVAEEHCDAVAVVAARRDQIQRAIAVCVNDVDVRQPLTDAEGRAWSSRKVERLPACVRAVEGCHEDEHEQESCGPGHSVLPTLKTRIA